MTVEIPETTNKNIDNEKLQYLLSENHKEELKEILAIGEKYKKEGKNMRNEFWGGYKRNKFIVDRRKIFVNLLINYKESEDRFMEGLEINEREVINRLNEIEKKKFFNEYLKDRILYSGDFKKEHEENCIRYYKYNIKDSLHNWLKGNKNKLQPGMKVDLSNNKIGDEGVKIIAKELKNNLEQGMKIKLNDNNIGIDGIATLAREWKDNLQQGMEIDLYDNKIGAKGLEILAEERRDSLKPGITINLNFNNIGDEGIATLAREWKDKLQPGMQISLYGNNIGTEGVKILAEERRDSLQPGMIINLGHNNIGDEGVKILAREWKDNLQPGIRINLYENNIGDEGVKILVREWKDSLQPGMEINLEYNDIGDKGADEIMKLDLKEGVRIYMGSNTISDMIKEKIEKYEQGYKDRGIDCEVLF